jgi:hypothetical protein
VRGSGRQCFCVGYVLHGSSNCQPSLARHKVVQSDAGGLPSRGGGVAEQCADQGTVDPVGESLRTHLDVLLHTWHGRMPISICRSFISGIRRTMTSVFSSNSPMIIGSACSGSDIASRCIYSFVRFAKDYFAIHSPPIKLGLAVENDPRKREFLLTQHKDLEFLMEDVAMLSQNKAFNHVTKVAGFIPWPRVFSAGFSCTSRSKLNPKSAQNRHCVQGESGETGKTFHAVGGFIVRVRPYLSILENLVELCEKDGPDDTSDEEFIVDYFATFAMACCAFRVNAADYGSCSVRRRLYFVIFDEPPSATSAARLTLVSRYLDSMKVGGGSFAEFCLTEDERDEWSEGMPVMRKSKKAKDTEGSVHLVVVSQTI